MSLFLGALLRIDAPLFYNSSNDVNNIFFFLKKKIIDIIFLKNRF
jgi:hypothetical protein